MKIQSINLPDILFLDIETVPGFENFDMLSPEMQKEFESKSSYQRNNTGQEEIPAGEYYRSHGGIWAEFGKIICVSAGFFSSAQGNVFRLRSFTGDEKDILNDFAKLLNTYYNDQNKYLCAHNGKEFDFPYIARRMIIHGIELPGTLNLFGKKPWEVQHLDTMELWKFGDRKHYTSLSLLTRILGIPSPKTDLDGSMVADVFYREHDLERIITYCEKDTVAVAQIFLRYRNMELLQPENIIYTGKK